jgi:hypothetical protein
VPDKLIEIEKGWRVYEAADGPPVSDVLWLQMRDERDTAEAEFYKLRVRLRQLVDMTAGPDARTNVAGNGEYGQGVRRG